MAFTFAAWSAASKCTSGPRPGAVALMKHLLAKHPKGKSLGIYNCRSVRGGSTTSTHGEGRALDIGFPMKNGRGTAAGYALVKQVGNHGAALGVQAIIYDRKIWSAKSPGGRAYTGAAPHYDHVHIELTRSAATNLTATKIKKILGGTSVAKPKPAPKPKPKPKLTPAQRIAQLRKRVVNQAKRIKNMRKRIKGK